MTARPSRLLWVALLTGALVLAGCSKGPAADQPPAAGAGSTVTSPATGSASASGSVPASVATSSPTSAAGDEVRGRSGGFSVVPPEGWAEATDQAEKVPNIDLVLLSSKKVGSFANNVVVLSSAGDQSVLDDQMDQGREQLGAAGRTVTAAPGRTVAGVPAVGFTTTFERAGVKVLARSYGVQRAGRIYLLTLSSSQADGQHALAELDELLSTWVWT